VLVRVAQVIDDGILHFFLQMCRLRAQLRHPIDHVDHQMKAGGFVEHRQLERGIDVAFFFVAAHVEVIVPLETLRELVDEPGIVVQVKDDRLVRGEQAVEFALGRLSRADARTPVAV